MWFSNDERRTRIRAFVSAYNEAHEKERDKSVQHQLQKIREDIERLHLIRYSIRSVYEEHRILQARTNAFIRTQPLNNTLVNDFVLEMKKEQYKRYLSMESFTDATVENERKTSYLFDEYIEEFEQAYKAKKETLVLLRLSVANDLVRMFAVYRLFSTVVECRPFVGRIFELFMHNIVTTSGLFIINEHLINAVLQAL